MRKRNSMAICLMSVVVLTLASVPISTQQGVRDYDPWCDVNDDGKIDIKDVATIAAKFGTEGAAINKTALLLDLQSRVDALEAKLVAINNTLIDLHVEIDSLTICQNSSWAADRVATSNTSWNFIPYMRVGLTLNTSCSVIIALCANWHWDPSFNYVRAVIDSACMHARRRTMLSLT